MAEKWQYIDAEWEGCSDYFSKEGEQLYVCFADDYINELEAQLAEARALLISGWTPADDMGRPCLDWVKRRNALLAGRSE